MKSRPGTHKTSTVAGVCLAGLFGVLTLPTIVNNGVLREPKRS